jgi:hypothetical protein
VQYSDSLDRAQLLRQKLLKAKLCCSYVNVIATKVYGPHHELIDCYEMSISLNDNTM